MAQAVAKGVVGVIVAPIFVAEADGPDMAVFRSRAEAEGFIEPPDADAVVFDGLGCRLRVDVQRGRTFLSVADNAAPRDPELVSRLRKFSESAHLELPASPDDWPTFIQTAASLVEEWMHRRT